MKVIDRLSKFLPSITDIKLPSAKPAKKPSAKAGIFTQGGGFTRILYSHTFTGEKDKGDIGPVRSYYVDYNTLRLRSWQAMLESDLAQIIIRKYARWVIGKGLKLQAQPNKNFLESMGITMDFEKFSKTVEAQFSLYANSNMPDFACMWRKSKISMRVFLNALIGGDVLVVLRLDDENNPTIQLIDGAHVQNPIGTVGTEAFSEANRKGNRIIHGIEIAPNGEHIAYWVRTSELTYESERIEAKGKKSGLKMAFLYYGLEYRLDNVRGLPLLSVVLESMAKLGRYKEATLGSAEEKNKIVYTIEHGVASTGEHPALQQLTRAVSIEADAADDDPVDVLGQQMADKIQATTSKMTYNMPKDSRLTSLDNKHELYFKDFYTININLLCATVDIPPDVALSMYNSNYSASRAALKDWEHSLDVIRDDHSGQFEQPVYDFWLTVRVLMNAIQAPGYIEALRRKDKMTLAAYRSARFVGANVPHIDPMKEVQAERLKLGDTASSIPLTTVEAATEALNGGDSQVNMEQFANELKQSKELGIELIEPPIPGENEGGKPSPKKKKADE